MAIERSGDDVRVHPEGPVVGVVRPPGSKSLTNRYLACTALAEGRSVLRGASVSDDTRAMVGGLAQLGVHVELQAGAKKVSGTFSASAKKVPDTFLDVHGSGGNLEADEVEIDAGNAGTAMRFLTALACLGYGKRRLDGSVRMRQRPIGALVGSLEALGAQIGYAGQAGFPPLTVLARGLRGGQVVFETPPSSQFLSALLMVAPYATQDVLTRVEGTLTSRPYVDMTIDVMRALGVEVLENEGRRFIVPAYQRYRAGDCEIEPDASAAAYFWAAAAVTGGRVRVEGLKRASRQGDVRFVDVLAGMGCRIHEDAAGLEVEGPASGRLKGVEVDLNDMPDTAQTLAVTALFADGPTTIRNVANLRIKETDRIAALGTELTRLGAQVDVRADGLTIHAPAQIRPAEIRTYDDHRMAMSFALAGLATDGIVIQDAGCVSKSFPGFFEVLGGLCPA